MAVSAKQQPSQLLYGPNAGRLLLRLRLPRHRMAPNLLRKQRRQQQQSSRVDGSSSSSRAGLVAAGAARWLLLCQQLPQQKLRHLL
jgi:hypothetical protein